MYVSVSIPVLVMFMGIHSYVHYGNALFVETPCLSLKLKMSSNWLSLIIQLLSYIEVEMSLSIAPIVITVKQESKS